MIPGPVNHYYNKSTEQPPTHTKETFTNLNIMTVYSLILKNLLIFMNKKHKFPQLIPQAILSLFIDHTDIENIQAISNSEPDAHNTNSAPTAISDRLASATNSIFIKGPRLYSEIADEANEANTPLLTHTTNAYKNTVKLYVLKIQSQGSSAEWSPDNSRLCTTKATRKSPRLNQTETVPQNQNYSSPMKF